MVIVYRFVAHLDLEKISDNELSLTVNVVYFIYFIFYSFIS